MIKISIIIPVYNVEQFVERCIRSVMHQTFTVDVECIVVDDCTPDKSMKIVKQMLLNYTGNIQFKLLSHDRNKGLAAARNTGLSIAEGDYILHVDSDDYCEPDMLESMYTIALQENADIVGCDFYCDFLGGRRIRKFQNFQESGSKCVEAILQGKLHSGNWNKLIKKELYLQHEILYPEGVNMWEDISTVVRLLFYARRIAYVPRALYHYVQYNTGAYTKKISTASIEQMKQAISILDHFFSDPGILPNFRKKMLYLKIFTRLQFVLYSDKVARRFYYHFYPEADVVIWRHPSFSLFHKLILWFGAHRGIKIAEILLRLKEFYGRFYA